MVITTVTVHRACNILDKHVDLQSTTQTESKENSFSHPIIHASSSPINMLSMASSVLTPFAGSDRESFNHGDYAVIKGPVPFSPYPSEARTPWPAMMLTAKELPKGILVQSSTSESAVTKHRPTSTTRKSSVDVEVIVRAQHAAMCVAKRRQVGNNANVRSVILNGESTLKMRTIMNLLFFHPHMPIVILGFCRHKISSV